MYALWMYFLGHMALGYFAASSTGKTTGTKYRLLLVWFFSMLPDIDLLLPFMSHRGATHSLAAILVLASICLVRRELLPYAASYASHIIAGDYITGGVQFLWPLTDAVFGVNLLLQPSLLETAVEIILFAAMLSLPQFKKEWAQEKELLSPVISH